MDAPPHNNNNRNNADATAAVPLPLMLPLSLPLSPLLTELDLTSAGLTTTLPDSLRPSLGSLHKLNLAHNALSTLPEWLDEAVHLRTLFLLGNAFESVPVVVGRLPSLFMLSFKSNRLTGTTGIPPGALPATLGWLILTDNALTGLPTDGTFGRLTRLRKCMLASNRLSALPSDIDKCEALELIRLSDNCLPARELDKLARLPRLAWIAYGGQQRVTAPEVSTRVDTIEGGALPFDSGLLTIGSLLGEGASGFVHRATFEGKEIALKVYKQASSDGRPIDEVEVAVSIPAHPSLPRILNVFAGENKLALAIELVENATVLGKTPSFDSCTRDVYGPTQTIKPERAVAIALRIAQAARHLHANKVMYVKQKKKNKKKIVLFLIIGKARGFVRSQHAHPQDRRGRPLRNPVRLWRRVQLRPHAGRPDLPL